MALALKYTHSKDGTKIAYYQIGSGPGLIIVHGAMQSGLSQSKLATALSQKFTCYLPDRRGRGKSGPTGENYSITKEVADLESVHVATGAKYIFGVSSGALITLKAALVAPSSHIERIALFEPPWWPEPEIEENLAWVRKYEGEIERGKVAEALTTAMLGSKMCPPLMQSKFFPRPLLVLLSRLMTRGEQGTAEKSKMAEFDPANPTKSKPTVRDLTPTLRNDFEVATEMTADKNFESLAGVKTEALIIGATRSPAFLRHSVDVLEKILPNARRVDLVGLDHGGTNDIGGKPEVFAEELLRFFTHGNTADAPRTD